MNVVLLGAPGSGKGTQAERLHQALKVAHVASGDLFRHHMKRETRLGLLAREFMNRGALVPDSVTIDMLRERLKAPDVIPGVVLDGFPRTLPQARALDEMLDGLGHRLNGVLHIQVPDEILIDRLSGRLVCKECQAPFHRTFNPFSKCPYNKCEGQYLYQREDDKAETVRARLATYHSQTAPLIEWYQSRGLLETVDGQGDVGQVTQRCLETIREFGAQEQPVDRRSRNATFSGRSEKKGAAARPDPIS